MADTRRELLFMAVLVLVLLLMAAQFSVVVGQQVGVTLKLHGVTIPNNSLVDYDDLLYREAYNSPAPTNANGFHDQTLVCETDLVNCCNATDEVRGNWYYPNGSIVDLDAGGRNLRFLSNRGQNEVINGRQFYGSVRLWRRFSPRERGRFRCELPSAADPNVSQTLYANILNFDPYSRPVTISLSGSGNAGETLSLMCLATLDLDHLPPHVPTPTFEWFSGPNGRDSLPSGVSSMGTVNNSSSTSTTYTSTLQFSPLSQSHAGRYTCRLGAGRLTNSAMVTVNAPPISVTVTANLNDPLMVGQTGNTLTCDVSGADNLNPMITYQWMRNDGSTQTPVGTDSNTLPLSPLSLSDAGDYNCSVTVSSALLTSDIITSVGNPWTVMIQNPDLQSVTVTSSGGTTVISGSDITINCIVELSPAVKESELPLLKVDAQLSRDGTILNLSDPLISSTTLIYTTVVNSFGRIFSGNYTCVATIRPQPSSVYLNGTGGLSDTIRVTTGVYFSSRSTYINQNSDFTITDIGEGDCGALLCFTDLTECCSDRDTSIGVGALGRWLYPNGSAIGEMSDGQDFYIDRGPSVVRLNRRSNVTSTTGLFCCEIPDATFKSIGICMNVVVPQSEHISTCIQEVVTGSAVAVAATLIFECLIGAPILAAVLARCWKRRLHRKPAKKTAYQTTILVKEDGVKKDAYNIPYKTATITQEGGVSDDVYEVPDYVATATTAVQSSGVREEVYEIPDDSNMATTNIATQGGGVQDNVYEVPDHSEPTTAYIKFELTECLAYGETTTSKPVETHPPAHAQDSHYV